MIAVASPSIVLFIIISYIISIHIHVSYHYIISILNLVNLKLYLVTPLLPCLHLIGMVTHQSSFTHHIVFSAFLLNTVQLGFFLYLSLYLFIFFYTHWDTLAFAGRMKFILIWCNNWYTWLYFFHLFVYYLFHFVASSYFLFSFAVRF